MTKEQQQVVEFMNLFRQQVFTRPTIPSLDVRRLRAKLILEEALETISALGLSVEWTNVHNQVVTPESVAIYESDEHPASLVEIADGLGDLHYVGYCGTAAACGIDMEPIFTEIHRSNMSKLWTEADLKRQAELHPTGVVEKYGEGLYRILVDGKVIKSPSYSPAAIRPILAKQLAGDNRA